MFLQFLFIIALLQFGKAQNQNGQCTHKDRCIVDEIYSLKGELQGEVRNELVNVPTKDDLNQKVDEMLEAVNNSAANETRRVMKTLVEMADSQGEIKSSVEQCMTRDEFQKEIQSLTRLVAEIKKQHR